MSDDKRCMVCGRPISEGEEAVPIMAEGGPLVGPEDPASAWVHLRCFQPEGTNPPSETPQ